MTKAQEIIEATTSKIIKLIEDGDLTGNWEKPWKALFGTPGTTTPANALTTKPYSGMNIIWLWISADANDYQHGVWATYKQWDKLGAQVRKDEKGTTCTRWGTTYRCLTEKKSTGFKPCPIKGHKSSRRMFQLAFALFNREQVDNAPDLPEAPEFDESQLIERAERFIDSTNADIEHVVGDSARHSFGGTIDRITLPERGQFKTIGGYYSTAFHELTHWTGTKDRLDRTNHSRYGDHAYAAEELVAEFGSAFLSAQLGIVADTENRAKYLKGWLKALKADPNNLFNAAQQASKAVAFLNDFQVEEEVAA